MVVTPPSVYDTHCVGAGLLRTTKTWSRFYCQWRRFMSDDTKTHDLPKQLDLTGKNVIITGSNSGIGAQAAEVCAKWGASVIFACRDPPPHEKHPEEVIEDIVARNPGVKRENLEWWKIDMGDLASIKAFGERWRASGRVCDYLFNNAGTAVGPLIRSKDGFELTRQINFLSHCLVTFYVLPTMKEAQAPRIINTASVFHYGGRIDFSNMDYEKKDNRGLGGVDAYCDTKLYLAMWSHELQKRLSRSKSYRHVITHSIHPGFVNSQIWALPHIQALPRILIRLLDWLKGLLSITTFQGSMGMLHAAFRPENGLSPAQIAAGPQGINQGESALVGGKFFLRTQEARGRPEIYDPLVTSRLWQRVVEDLKISENGLATDIPGHPAGIQ